MIKKKARSETRLAVAWYSAEEWEKLRAVSADAAKLEPTYAEWLAHGEMAMQEAKRVGLEVVKVDVAVEELAAWCRKKGLQIDGRARARYAAERADGIA